jgi:AmmeMemoRadiSam system protein B
MKRYPAAEGRFYPGTKDSIFKLIGDIESNSSIDVPQEKIGNIIGAILPHAGHMFSAYQTIPFFRYLKKYKIQPETFIILNPNHSGMGPEIALDPNNTWVNSIGEIDIDIEINSLLPYPVDARAQQQEHSAEVIIPFMQYYQGDFEFKILPICMKQISSQKSIKLAEDLHHAIRSTGRSTIVIASSDFSHFLSPEEGKEKDDLVLKTIEDQDIRSLEKVVNKNNISVCGYCPIMSLMAYSELSEPNYTSTILARGHSGEVVPSSDVVDYISILFHSKS